MVAHFLVGNAYQYTTSDWERNIRLAASKGIDAFALNVGSDEWQVTQVAQAFTASNTCADDGFNFNLFVSFDMGSSESNYLRFNGRPLISPFSGQDCTFGRQNFNAGWTYAINSTASELIHFIPSFFVDPTTFPGATVMDGAFNNLWNAAWPMGDYDIGFGPDEAYINNLDGRSYMAGDFIYRCDDWLLAERWEVLVQNHKKVDIAQVITWNDCGESHYLAPLSVHDSQPNSQAWVDSFDHQGWLDLLVYYIVALKTGQYPTVDRDRIFLWAARLYPANVDAHDSVGRPTNWQFTKDFAWAVVLLAETATVVLQCGPSRETSREDGSGMVFTPSNFDFQTDPPMYNFNALVAASP
ncbi:glycoside hydrolase [Mycena sp. CBHHK59/15]|nr:glycoside hydrolase [Mycena sp. CBHHK59/15]